MKKLLVLFCIIFCTAPAYAKTDYQQTYLDLPVPTHRYIHDLDPDEYYDTKDTSWSPYPLLRLTAPIFFKSITIEPGYYNLTPREHKGKWYMLFKESGRIKYIIPVYNRDIVPEMFYKDNLPQPKRTWTQTLHIKTLDFIGRHFEKSKRKPAYQTYIEITDLDNNFISMVIYVGNYRYYTIFRTIQL